MAFLSEKRRKELIESAYFHFKTLDEAEKEYK